MTTPVMQYGTVYRYVRIDADRDLSALQVELTINEDSTPAWTGATYIPPEDWPPCVAAADSGSSAPAGLTGYWFQFLTGPATPFPLSRGINIVYGRCPDLPETPHFGWRIIVGLYE